MSPFYQKRHLPRPFSLVSPRQWEHDPSASLERQYCVELSADGEISWRVWSPWSHFRKLTAFADGDLMQTCESCFVLVSCLCSMSNWLGRRNARACLRKSCCINFLSERLFFSSYLFIFFGVQWLSYLRLNALSKQSLIHWECARGNHGGCSGTSYPSTQTSQTNSRGRWEDGLHFCAQDQTLKCFLLHWPNKTLKECKENSPWIKNKLARSVGFCSSRLSTLPYWKWWKSAPADPYESCVEKLRA